MAYLETVMNGIIDTLRANGHTAYSEYELQTAPVPKEAVFITAGIAQLSAEPPLHVDGGSAFPTALSLRFRIHGRPSGDPDRLAILWETAILPELMDAGYAVRETKLGEVQYSKTLDRTVREARVTIAALLTRTAT